MKLVVQQYCSTSSCAPTLPIFNLQYNTATQLDKLLPLAESSLIWERARLQIVSAMPGLHHLQPLEGLCTANQLTAQHLCVCGTYAPSLQSMRNLPCMSGLRSGITACTSVRPPTSVLLAKTAFMPAIKILTGTFRCIRLVSLV